MKSFKEYLNEAYTRKDAKLDFEKAVSDLYGFDFKSKEDQLDSDLILGIKLKKYTPDEAAKEYKNRVQKQGEKVVKKMGR